MAKKKANGKSKTATILELRSKYADDTYKQLSERAAGLGVEVSPNYVATIISNAKKKKQVWDAVPRTGGEHPEEPAQPAPKRRTRAGDTFERVQTDSRIEAAAIELMHAAGGVSEAINVLMGFRKSVAGRRDGTEE